MSDLSLGARRARMPTKLSPIILFICLIPVAILAFVAVWSLQLERNALEARRELLIRQSMAAAGAQIEKQIEPLGLDVIADVRAGYDRDGAASLSAMARERRFLYARIFAKSVALQSATALEHQYEVLRILQDKAEALAAALGPDRETTAALIPFGEAYTLLRCAHGADGLDICVALNGDVVAAALEASLAGLEQGSGLGKAGLIAPNGRNILPHGASVTGPDVQALGGLLAGWTLRGEDNAAGMTSLQNSLDLYLIAGALTLGWLAMMWMLHRSAVLKEQAASARASVIAQLAHELRTPLANLRLYTDLLRRDPADAPAVERYGEVLDGEIDRLSHIAENAIVVARGAMATPKLETAVPDDCVRMILDRFQPMLRDAGCQVTFRPGASDSCRFDRTSWERCLINIIDNARKYAPGSMIEISSSRDHGMLYLSVADNGPGIAADQLEQIFEPLERGAGTKASGFGLGLAAVRALARQNGGRCWAELLTPGARFNLTMQAWPANSAAGA